MSCRPLLLLLTLSLAGWSQLAAAEDLAKASQNPVGDLVSVPFEVWQYEGMPGDSGATVGMLKPVLPVNLGQVNLVSCCFRNSSGEPTARAPQRISSG
jgi:hypothetical protein